MVEFDELTAGLLIFTILSILEILTTKLKLFWQLKVPMSVINSALLGISTSLMIMNQPVWLKLVIIYLASIQLILILRIAGGKINPVKNRKLSSISAVWLYLFLIVSITAPKISSVYLWICLISLVILLLSIISVVIKLRKSSSSTVNVTDTPTVTLAIPSRNESYDLVCLLEQALKSEYPKLEIMVLDDCSSAGVNEIIKNFAHQGVIFLHGTEPKKHWLAKNWAYQQLLHNANGEYVIFAGVDIRLNPKTITQIVDQLVAGDYDALSVLPKRIWQKNDKYLFLQSLRYHRLISGFMHIRSLPPPLSSCFAIKRKTVLKLGGFQSARGSIYPEKMIAKTVSNYGFMLANNKNLEVQSVKSFKGQFNTAVRTYYPLAKFRMELVALRTIILGIMYVVSLFSIYQLFLGNINQYGLSVLIVAYSLHWLVGYRLGIGNVVTWTLQLPILVLSEIFIMHYSMIKYEFFEVVWKDRNACIPLLRYEKVMPNLGT